MLKIILAVLFLFCCVSIGYAVDFDEGDSWVSSSNGNSRYVKLGIKHLHGDRVKEMNIAERIYEFKKSGHNLYKAYDDETGNFFEMKKKGRGGFEEWEIYKYETGEQWLQKESSGRK